MEHWLVIKREGLEALRVQLDASTLRTIHHTDGGLPGRLEVEVTLSPEHSATVGRFTQFFCVECHDTGRVPRSPYSKVCPSCLPKFRTQAGLILKDAGFVIEGDCFVLKDDEGLRASVTLDLVMGAVDPVGLVTRFLQGARLS